MQKMSRRTFLKLCTSALLALGLGRFIPASAAGRTIKFPRQIITADSTTSRTIMWQAEGARQQASFTLTSANGPSQNYCRASSIYITINHLLKSGYKDTSLTLAFSLVNSQ